MHWISTIEPKSVCVFSTFDKTDAMFYNVPVFCCKIKYVHHPKKKLNDTSSEGLHYFEITELFPNNVNTLQPG